MSFSFQTASSVLSSLAVDSSTTSASPFELGMTVGLIVVGVAAGIIKGIPLVNEWLKKKRKRNDQDASASSPPVDPDLVDSNPHVKKNKNFVFPIDLQKHSLLHERITEFRTQQHADFVSICYFHNGGNFLDGSPIKRVSSVYESLKEGRESFSHYFKNIFVSEILQLIRPIDATGYALFSVAELDYGFLRTILESKGVHSVCALPITKHSNNMELVIGMLVVGLSIPLTEKTDDKIKQEMLNDTEKLTSQIELEILSSANRSIVVPQSPGQARTGFIWQQQPTQQQ